MTGNIHLPVPEVGLNNDLVVLQSAARTPAVVMQVLKLIEDGYAWRVTNVIDV